MIYILAILLLISYALFMRIRYELQSLQVTVVNIEHNLVKNDGPTFVFISDLHSVSFGLDNQSLINKIKSINPDCILIGGDMITCKKKSFHGDVKAKETSISFLRRLCQDFPVYYAMGNHEIKASSSPSLKEDFKDYLFQIKSPNLHILMNTCEYATFKGTRFCIYGLFPELKYYSKKNPVLMTPEYIKYTLSPDFNERFAIPLLLSHNPEHFKACALSGAPYVFSGHNHGGYIRIPKLGGLISSSFKLFPKYDGGVYKEDKSFMILSRGLGTHTIPVRLLNKPEINVIHFESNSKS